MPLDRDPPQAHRESAYRKPDLQTLSTIDGVLEWIEHHIVNTLQTDDMRDLHADLPLDLNTMQWMLNDAEVFIATTTATEDEIERYSDLKTLTESLRAYMFILITERSLLNGVAFDADDSTLEKDPWIRTLNVSISQVTDHAARQKFEVMRERLKSQIVRHLQLPNRMMHDSSHDHKPMASGRSPKIQKQT